MFSACWLAYADVMYGMPDSSVTVLLYSSESMMRADHLAILKIILSYEGPARASVLPREPLAGSRLHHGGPPSEFGRSKAPISTPLEGATFG